MIYGSTAESLKGSLQGIKSVVTAHYLRSYGWPCRNLKK